MKPDDDDFRIGVPGAGRAAVAQPRNGFATPPRDHAPDVPPELRPGETELGRPPQVPADLEELSAADLKALKLLDDEQAQRDITEAELLLASDPTGLGWLGWFGSPLVFAFLLGMAGVFGIFFFNQTLTLINALRQQPEWAQYVGFAGLGLFAFCVLRSEERRVG